MSLLKDSIIEQLIQSLKYTSLEIGEIEKSATLVSLLNNFNGKLTYNSSYNGAFYSSSNNEIVLGKPPYNDLPTLAHELGHATGHYQASYVDDTSWLIFEKYISAEAYSKDRMRGEGEAIYYEMKVMQELGLPTSKNILIWRNNQPQPNSEDVSVQILSLMNQYPAGEELFDKIGEINGLMVASGQNGVAMTYDEFNKFFYLTQKDGLGNLNQDYKEVIGSDLYQISNGQLIPLDVVLIKSLVNSGNNHFNEDKNNANDTLINHHPNGSVLARKYDKTQLSFLR